MRIIGLVDSDSYVKWGAALLGQLSSDWSRQLIVVRSAKLPSEQQLQTALVGTGIDPETVQVLDLDDAVAYVAAHSPHAVLVATIGPLADLLADGIMRSARVRPVLISGIPGIALPARRKALVYRSQIDVMVLHSHREVRRFQKLATANGFDHQFVLAHLPFISRSATVPPVNGDVVFAAQAIVPLPRSQRVQILDSLVEFARQNPLQRVVIKVRALGHERQTHDEEHSFAALLDREFSERPSNVVVEAGPMAAHLDAAAVLVTVSSTAIIEAMARGIPVLAINDFGVRRRLLNDVFRLSGILGSLADLQAHDYRSPTADWARDNYLHDSADNNWADVIRELVRRAEREDLPIHDRVVRGRGGFIRRAWDRKRVLGRFDRSVLGYAALAVGAPARSVVVWWRATSRRLGIRRQPTKTVALTREASTVQFARFSAHTSR